MGNISLIWKGRCYFCRVVYFNDSNWPDRFYFSENGGKYAFHPTKKGKYAKLVNRFPVKDFRNHNIPSQDEYFSVEVFLECLVCLDG